MNDDSTQSSKKRAEVENALLLDHLVKRKWKYFWLALIVGVTTSIYLKLFIIEYESSGTFYINEENVISSVGVDLKSFESLSQNDNILRISQLINSSEVKQHLIKKFDLARHYGVDTTKEFYFQQTENILTSNIVCKKTPYNTIYVGVNDRFRYLAADMVNEIMNEVDEITRAYYISIVERKLRLSEAYLKSTQKDNAIKLKNLDSLISKMHTIASGSNKTASSLYILQQEEKLSSLVNEMYNSSRDLNNSQRLYNLALQALNQQNFQAITIVQSAMPASYSNIYLCILYGILTSVAIICLLIVYAYFRIHYEDVLKLFMGKSK
jgi:hypothetical protein